MSEVDPPAGATVRKPRASAALLRLFALIGLIAVCGVAVGFAIGYPVSQIQPDVQTATQLPHAALAGTFEPADALAQLEDMPDGWTPVELPFPISLLSAEICGASATIDNQVGDSQAASYTDPQGRGVIVAEAVRVRNPRDATTFIDEMGGILGSCEFFYRLDGDERLQVEISPGQPNLPVGDSVSRTLLEPEQRVRVVYFQVGDAIVSITYLGQTKPSKELLDRAMLGVLERIAPDQFSQTADVPGLVPLPTEATTTSTTTTLPPTSLSTTTTR